MKKFFGIILIVLLFWSILIEPNLLIVKKYQIKNTDMAGLRVVFVSDLHLKRGASHRLERVVSKIKKQNPDILLFGGDFFEETNLDNLALIDDIALQFVSLKPKYGMFAVLGNHEMWSDSVGIENILRNHGIKVLNDENYLIKIDNKKFYIVGLVDVVTQQVDLSKALFDVKNPVILLSHSPDIFADIPPNVDLVLAGHTHGGQVNIPFVGPPIVPSDFGDKYAYGLIEEDGKKMIVTSGIGTSILPIRFNCPPEIVVIDFCKE